MVRFPAGFIKPAGNGPDGVVIMTDLYVANTSATVTLAGQRTWIKKGVTIVRAGHPIMDGRESLFDPVKVHFDTGGVEQMTAAPGEKRQLDLDSRAVREWAAANDIEVAPRGKLPAEVVEAYKAAQE